MKKILTGIVLSFVLAASLGGTATARQQQPAPSAGDAQGAEQQQHRHMGRRGRRDGMRGRGHRMGGLRQLNLSDAQRQQIRGIHETTSERTRAQREELHGLFQQKRQGGQLTAEQEARANRLLTELRQTRKRVHEEILAVLTPDQRTQLEQQRQEQKQRREERRQRRPESTPDANPQ